MPAIYVFEYLLLNTNHSFELIRDELSVRGFHEVTFFFLFFQFVQPGKGIKPPIYPHFEFYAWSNIYSACLLSAFDNIQQHFYTFFFTIVMELELFL